MARECEICGKKTTAGQTYKRSGLSRREGGGGQRITGKTKRKFKPNIQKIRAVIDGNARVVKMCTRCMKTNVVKPLFKKAVAVSK